MIFFIQTKENHSLTLKTRFALGLGSSSFSPVFSIMTKTIFRVQESHCSEPGIQPRFKVSAGTGIYVSCILIPIIIRIIFIFVITIMMPERGETIIITIIFIFIVTIIFIFIIIIMIMML